MKTLEQLISEFKKRAETLVSEGELLPSGNNFSKSSVRTYMSDYPSDFKTMYYGECKSLHNHLLVEISFYNSKRYQNTKIKRKSHEPKFVNLIKLHSDYWKEIAKLLGFKGFIYYSNDAKLNSKVIELMDEIGDIKQSKQMLNGIKFNSIFDKMYFIGGYVSSELLEELEKGYDNYQNAISFLASLKEKHALFSIINDGELNGLLLDKIQFDYVGIRLELTLVDSFKSIKISFGDDSTKEPKVISLNDLENELNQIREDNRLVYLINKPNFNFEQLLLQTAFHSFKLFDSKTSETIYETLEAYFGGWEDVESFSASCLRLIEEYGKTTEKEKIENPCIIKTHVFSDAGSKDATSLKVYRFFYRDKYFHLIFEARNREVDYQTIISEEVTFMVSDEKDDMNLKSYIFDRLVAK